MIKEFIPYDLALQLKRLGFDKPCFGYYFGKDKEAYLLDGQMTAPFEPSLNSKVMFRAPLYQQSFKFFREKYNLCGEVYTVNMGAIDYSFQIRDLYSENYIHDNFEAYPSGYIGTFLTYEEAELECLKKLIEIVEKSTDLPY